MPPRARPPRSGRPGPNPRLERTRHPSLDNLHAPAGRQGARLSRDVILDCGWGRLIFAHTFRDLTALAETLLHEQPGTRDIALYLRDPHVVLSLAPQELFLDPSHTYRLWLHRYRPPRRAPKGFVVRPLRTRGDAREVNRIFAARGMVTVDEQFQLDHRRDRTLTFRVAEEPKTGKIVGAVTGVDHVHAFDDPEGGSSLWCLAVDPQSSLPGVGEALVRHLAEQFAGRGRTFMDLSVLHDNLEAIRLYEKLGFERVPVFCLKHKNPINEPLFLGPDPASQLNPYARIIIDEARRRGIGIEVLDEQEGYFSLTQGGRTIVCRESLSELTSAIAMSRCDDKRVTHRVLARGGLQVPEQIAVENEAEAVALLDRHPRLVVKPARGEQGAGVAVDLRSTDEVAHAYRVARRISDRVVVERFIEGDDLRVVVIGFEVVAAAIRRPPEVVGTGTHTVLELIQALSRRRAAATGGESKIPLNDETKRCVAQAGFALEEVLPEAVSLTVRKTANLHTGGTIHDVTDRLHPDLAEAAIRAARLLDIPVVGLDLLVPDVEAPDYVIVEANERPGLANHEPQPTAARFVDLLFPQSIPTTEAAR